MGNNLFQVLLTTIKAKITPVVTKIKLWTSWNFIRTRLISKIRDFFSSLLNIKPRHKKDYYTIGSWMISRRLMIAVVVVVGVVSLIYLISVNSTLTSARQEGIKTYAYDSLLLRFVSEKVRITGESGYLAYEGNVENGGVNGYGILYNPKGTVVYQGNFADNLYQGNGTLYYDNGAMHYNGAFQNNLFEGSGKLYRENGSLAYEGEFMLGRKEGKGSLYDSGSNLIYSGSFSNDAIHYSSLLGKALTEMTDIYFGQRTLYEDDEFFAVIMEDISAMYLGSEPGGVLEEGMVVDRIYVLQNTFPAGDEVCSTIEQVSAHLGEAANEGNSDIVPAEAVAAHWLAERDAKFALQADLETTAEYEDYLTIESFDDSRMVYLYVFYKDGLIYTFVCADESGEFLFYSIEKGESAAVG